MLNGTPGHKKLVEIICKAVSLRRSLVEFTMPDDRGPAHIRIGPDDFTPELPMKARDLREALCWLFAQRSGGSPDGSVIAGVPCQFSITKAAALQHFPEEVGAIRVYVQWPRHTAIQIIGTAATDRDRAAVNAHLAGTRAILAAHMDATRVPPHKQAFVFWRLDSIPAGLPPPTPPVRLTVPSPGTPPEDRRAHFQQMLDEFIRTPLDIWLLTEISCPHELDEVLKFIETGHDVLISSGSVTEYILADLARAQDLLHRLRELYGPDDALPDDDDEEHNLWAEVGDMQCRLQALHRRAGRRPIGRANKPRFREEDIMHCDILESRGPVRLVRVIGSQQSPTYCRVQVKGEGEEEWRNACEPCSEKAARDRFDQLCQLVEKGQDQ